jgi:hypothetical protein
VNILQQLDTKNPLLSRTGWGFAVLSGVLLLMIPFNTTEVLGINSLLKPLKFSLSIWIYSWTMAVLLDFFEDRRLVRRISVISVVVMVYEQAVITVQALRGTLSHFNQNSLLEGVLFGLMGLMITWITLEVLRAALLFRKQKDSLHPALKSGIFWGMIVFIAACLIGGYMSYLGSHQIGGPMGEAGLPLLNWSTRYGDVRVSHFVGLHALQLIPLFAWWVAGRVANPTTATTLVWVFSGLYGLVIAATLIQALLGIALSSAF